MGYYDYASGLLNLTSKRLEVWQLENGIICVQYHNCDVKDGLMLHGAFGQGRTFEKACEDYYKQISGKTLIFDAGTNSRTEVVVL